MSFLTFSELQLCENGVFVVSRHRDAVFMIVRGSTCLQRQFRDGVGATQVRPDRTGAGLFVLAEADVPEARDGSDGYLASHVNLN